MSKKSIGRLLKEGFMPATVRTVVYGVALVSPRVVALEIR